MPRIAVFQKEPCLKMYNPNVLVSAQAIVCRCPYTLYSAPYLFQNFSPKAIGFRFEYIHIRHDFLKGS